MEKIRGLNLGGWLVLEKWMTPELYKDSIAEDEYHLLSSIPYAEERLKKHRDNFILESDFEWISKKGINTVRIPLGHWTFKAEKPYFEAKRYLDNAFRWAEKYNLNVVLDVHAAKGCQNGFDNGGLSGICEWHKDVNNVNNTIDFIRDLCENYSKEKSLVGIELLNEPSITIDIDIIQSFYLEGYSVIRKHLGDEIIVIFHDAFRINEWNNFFKDNNFVNVYLDTHMYQVFGDIENETDIFRLYNFILKDRLEVIRKIKIDIPIIIGEWSIGLSKKLVSKARDNFQYMAYLRSIANLLFLVFEEANGWFFWNYKLSDQSTENNPGWSFKKMVELNILPFDKERF
ncbi:MAG: cellulase family glycosylhydrolase [Candidatus Izemoplasmatales bacterium]